MNLYEGSICGFRLKKSLNVLMWFYFTKREFVIKENVKCFKRKLKLKNWNFGENCTERLCFCVCWRFGVWRRSIYGEDRTDERKKEGDTRKQKVCIIFNFLWTFGDGFLLYFFFFNILLKSFLLLICALCWHLDSLTCWS